jgi:hypothetical protein
MPNDCRHAEYAVLVINSQKKEIYRGYTSDKRVAKFQVNAYDEYEVGLTSVSADVKPGFIDMVLINSG